MTPRWWLAPSMKFRSYTSVPYLLGNHHGMMTYITVFCVVACYICLFSSSSFFSFFSFLSSVLCGVSCACVCLVCVWKERGKEMFIKSGVITTEEEAKCMLCKASLSTRNGRRWPDAIVCVCVCVCEVWHQLADPPPCELSVQTSKGKRGCAGCGKVTSVVT